NLVSVCLRLVAQHEDQIVAWRSLKEHLECQTSSILMTEELVAMMNQKRQRHVVFSYIDLNLVEEEKDLDHHMPQDLHRVRYLPEVICKSQFQTSFGKAFLSYLLRTSLCSGLEGEPVELFEPPISATRSANSDSVVLCCCGRGGRVIGVVVVVAVKIGA
ncbi:hypothetical protein Tco_1479780, partial [Tanacetum coccineum]